MDQLDFVYCVTVTIVHEKKNKRKQLVIRIRKKNVRVHIIIMFQSFIRHARVMNNFFVTSTDHLSLPLHFPRSLDGFGVPTSLWSTTRPRPTRHYFIYTIFTKRAHIT